MMDAGFRPELLGGRWEQSRGPVFHTAGSWVRIPFPETTPPKTHVNPKEN